MPQTQRALFLSPHPLIPITGGGAARALSLMQYVKSLGYETHCVAPLARASNHPAVQDSMHQLWHPPGHIPLEKGNDLIDWMLSTLFGQREALHNVICSIADSNTLVPEPCSNLEHRRNTRVEDFAWSMAHYLKPSLVCCLYAWSAHIFRRPLPPCLKIIDTIDLQHVRFEKSFKAGVLDPALIVSKDEEAKLLGGADVLLAIQEEEARELQSLCPQQEVLCVRHAAYKPTTSDSTLPGEIFFAGNIYKPNVLGLQSFIDSVMPRILEQCPHARLSVCGKVCEEITAKHPAVCLHGVVENLDPYLSRAEVVINPVSFGTGLKIKSIEALGRGKCLVATRAGTLGLSSHELECLVEVPHIEDMALPIIELLTNPSLRASYQSRAKEHAARFLTPEVIYSELGDRLRRLVNNSNRVEGI